MTGKTVTIFGHQVPVVALVGLAGVLGVILVMRARSKHTSVVSAGTTAAAAAAAQSVAAATTYDPNLQGLVSGGTPYAGTPDYGSQLAYLQAQITGLNTPAASTPTAASTPAAPSAPAHIGSDVVSQIEATYEADLGRVADPAGLANWVSWVNSGRFSLQGAENMIAASPEAQQYAIGQAAAARSAWAASHPPAGAAVTVVGAAHVA